MAQSVLAGDCTLPPFPARQPPPAEAVKIMTALPLPGRHGRVIRVTPDTRPSLDTVVAQSRAGDTIELAPGTYHPGQLRIEHDLTLRGIGRPTLEWFGGTGPYIRLAGFGTRLAIEGVSLLGHEVNTALLGDPNVAYEPPEAFEPIVHLIDVDMANDAGVDVYVSAHDARYEISGGRYVSCGNNLLMEAGYELRVHSSPLQRAQLQSLTHARVLVHAGFSSNGRIAIYDSIFSAPTDSFDVLLWRDVAQILLARNDYHSTSRHIGTQSLDDQGVGAVDLTDTLTRASPARATP